MTHRIPVLTLSVVIVSLLLIGLVSGTIVRHTIQIVPGTLALAALLRGREWGVSAALPIFAFWLFIVILIWLFLLGIARIARGHFSPAEIVLTVAIGVACFWGLIGSGLGRIGWPARVAAMAFFLGLQIATMWLSVQPSFARR